MAPVRLSAFIGRTIESFESGALDCPLDTDRIGLLLLLAGEKHAIELMVRGESAATPEAVRPLDPDILARVVNFIASLRLHCKALPKRTILAYADAEPYAAQVIVLVANSLANLKRAEDLWSTGVVDQSQQAQLHGELSGFPASSVMAYLEGSLIEDADIPRETRLSEAYCFGRFRYSQTHWRSELATGQRWAKIVRELCPELYEATMSARHKIERHRDLELPSKI